MRRSLVTSPHGLEQAAFWCGDFPISGGFHAWASQGMLEGVLCLLSGGLESMVLAHPSFKVQDFGGFVPGVLLGSGSLPDLEGGLSVMSCPLARPHLAFPVAPALFCWLIRGDTVSVLSAPHSTVSPVAPCPPPRPQLSLPGFLFGP